MIPDRLSFFKQYRTILELFDESLMWLEGCIVQRSTAKLTARHQSVYPFSFIHCLLFLLKPAGGMRRIMILLTGVMENYTLYLKNITILIRAPPF